MLTMREASRLRIWTHIHRCRQCGQQYSAFWVWDGFPYFDDCACQERVCPDCQQAEEEEQVDEQR